MSGDIVGVDPTDKSGTKQSKSNHDVHLFYTDSRRTDNQVDDARSRTPPAIHGGRLCPFTNSSGYPWGPMMPFYELPRLSMGPMMPFPELLRPSVGPDLSRPPPIYRP